MRGVCAPRTKTVIVPLRDQRHRRSHLLSVGALDSRVSPERLLSGTEFRSLNFRWPGCDVLLRGHRFHLSSKAGGAAIFPISGAPFARDGQRTVFFNQSRRGVTG
jgi:hypothetical protein